MAASEKALLQSKEEEILELREQIQALTNSRPQEPAPIPMEGNVESGDRQDMVSSLFCLTHNVELTHAL